MPNPLPTPTPPKNANSGPGQGMTPPAPPKPMAPPAPPSNAPVNPAQNTNNSQSITPPPTPQTVPAVPPKTEPPKAQPSVPAANSNAGSNPGMPQPTLKAPQAAPNPVAPTPANSNQAPAAPVKPPAPQAPAPVVAPKPPTPPTAHVAPKTQPSVPSQPAAPAVKPPVASPAPTPAQPSPQPPTAKLVAPAATPVPPAPPAPQRPATPQMPPRPPMPQTSSSPLPPPGMPPSPSGTGPRPPGMPPAPPAPPASAAPTAASAQPQMASAKGSPLKKLLPFILGGLALLGIIGLAIAFLPRLLGGGATPLPGSNTNTTSGTSKNQTTLTYWGLWEPNAVMDQVFRDFEQANPGVKIEYVKQSHLDYRQRLQTAISQGNGPDLFRFHATWTPMLRDELAVMPSSVYTPATFQSTFYPVAAQQLQYAGQLRGVPLMYDGLALYYNEDMLKAANAEVPKTWAELRILADNLTIRANNNVERGGLAIGNATNVEHFADILGLLMLQNGADPAKPTSSEAEQALIFYTDFVKEYNVWSDTLPNSTVAFARGDVAMMFAPSWRAHEIIAQNPSLKFGIAPVPQLGERNVAWASYWAEGVNVKGKNKDLSWKLISYMSSAEVMKKMYGQQSTVRRFGELYSRRDLANDLSGEAYAVPFLSDAPNARGWYLSSYTHDNGLNDMSIKYYKDAVTAVLKNGTQPKAALETVNQGINQVLRQFGVSTSTTQTAPSTTSNAGS